MGYYLSKGKIEMDMLIGGESLCIVFSDSVSVVSERNTLSAIAYTTTGYNK